MENGLTLILIVFMIGYLVYSAFSKKTKLFDTKYIKEGRAALFVKIGRICFVAAAVLSLHIAVTALYSVTEGAFPKDFDLVPEWVTRVVIAVVAALVLTPFVLAIVFTDKQKYMEKQRRERGEVSAEDRAEIFAGTTADGETPEDDGSAADPFGDRAKKKGQNQPKG